MTRTASSGREQCGERAPDSHSRCGARAPTLRCAVVATSAAVPAVYKNCTALNTKYPHGVGKLNARDRTSGSPVTAFKRSTRLYNIADKYNGVLDRDNDGACEKK